MRPKLGLALGSGGARGWSHIGVLNALARAGIEPDFVCGTSMGALVGAAHASGNLHRLEAFARSLGRGTVARLIDINPASGGLVEGRLVAERLRALGYAERFEDLRMPFVAVASDLFGEREVWLRSGNLVDAVRASIAIPGIFSPVHHEGKWLLDGGMMNPIPVSACRALGADVVIAVDPNAKLHAYRRRLRSEQDAPVGPEPAGLIDATPALLRPYLESLRAFRAAGGPRPPNYFSVLSASIDLMVDQISRSRLAGDPPHLVLYPDLAELTILDFQCAEQAIEAGERAVAVQMEALRMYL